MTSAGGIDPLSLAIALAVLAAGVALFWHGQVRGKVPERIAGVIVGIAPLLIHKPSSLLGFVGGVALALWMYRRVM